MYRHRSTPNIPTDATCCDSSVTLRISWEDHWVLNKNKVVLSARAHRSLLSLLSSWGKKVSNADVLTWYLASSKEHHKDVKYYIVQFFCKSPHNNLSWKTLNPNLLQQVFKKNGTLQWKTLAEDNIAEPAWKSQDKGDRIFSVFGNGWLHSIFHCLPVAKLWSEFKFCSKYSNVTYLASVEDINILILLIYFDQDPSYWCACVRQLNIVQ